MTRTFVITLAFEKQWANIELNDEDLQNLILENAQVGGINNGGI